MKYYRLNKNVQKNGDHEVHKEGCAWYPTANYASLGQHEDCKSAVKKAKQLYPNWKINGCAHCIPECHTS